MKKYSDKFLNSFDILKKAKIGFEFEAYFNDSYYKVLENLNAYLAPIKVHGFKTYHSNFTVDANNFKLERDLSGGVNMAEIVTGPQDYFSAKTTLVKVLKFLSEHAHTNSKSALHINISFPKYDLKNLNKLKLLLSVDEDLIFQKFPTRKNNIYTKSVLNLIPFENYDFYDMDIQSVANVLKIPNDKYYGVNLTNIDAVSNQRIEFRYIGGEGYHKKVGDIIELMDSFVIDCYNALVLPFNNDNIEKLKEVLNNKISSFKNISSYDNFLIEYPNLELQINQNSQYQIVSSYYPKIYNKIFLLLDSIIEIDEGIINYYSGSAKIEIINTKVEASSMLENVDFINCDIISGLFSNCGFYKCDILNSDISKSKINNSDVKKSKLTSVNADNSNLIDCFFQSGYLNSRMVGGVFRSGRIGELADISPDTKVVKKDRDSFFDTSYDEDEKKNK